MTEIERKFLVTNTDFKREATSQKRIVQAFLNRDPHRTIRVRIKGEKAFLTVKGIGNNTGTTRFEWEKEITPAEAQTLLPLCEDGKIEKIRYEVPFGGFLWEVDVFEGKHNGLIIAEIELNHENQSFPKPHWLGNEVTGNPDYYNSNL
ncbi:CYTH domain-containing protein [Capnocytophaga sp.]|uniref:CYTH domain-containing protein n=1 Tax=Capnocytophaga sp. TaxID=44737 RepID=UPI0026DC6AD2|nr:CYTH domain-containing protein [Capnocytophaga sp.]MDO5104356.1 CYTH domain-containing protein [Capnocytophaga sp.]